MEEKSMPVIFGGLKKLGCDKIKIPYIAGFKGQKNFLKKFKKRC